MVAEDNSKMTILMLKIKDFQQEPHRLGKKICKLVGITHTVYIRRQHQQNSD